MALSPEYLQGLPEELENLTMQFEADIIADISRRIAKAGTITDTAEYQMMILKEMGASTEYLEKRISEYTGYSEELVRQMIFDAAQTDSDFYESVYARANRPYVPFEYNEYLQGLAVAAVNQTCGELNNFTRTMGFSARGTDGRIYFKSCADTYRSAMDKAHTLVVYGGADYMTAVRMATKEITAAGLQFVDYASGVRNHADVAVRRALLTGVSQMTGKVSERNAEQLDTDVVEVSAHAGARPDHAVWQGKWFSLKGKDKRYPLLAAATGYGSVSGLKGANCRHDFYPVIPGIDEPAYTAEQLRHIDPPPVTIDGRTYTYYEAEQRQRAFERAIRKTKREIIAADASHDEEMFTAKSVLLRRQKEAYGEFSKQAGLLPRIERTGVAEYGRSISAKAVWADRKSKITADSVDYMSNSFRPKFSTANPIHLGSGKTVIEIPVKQVSNSHYTLYTDVDVTPKNKAVRLVEKIMPSVEKQIPEGFILPPIAVIDFEKNNLNSSAIGAYNSDLNILFFNSKYNTKDKIVAYVSANSGYFANKTEYAPFLHELGHKNYYDCIKSLAFSEKIGYNDAKAIIDKKILDQLLDVDIEDSISTYAYLGFIRNKPTEVAAECFTIRDENSIANKIFNSMKR